MYRCTFAAASTTSPGYLIVAAAESETVSVSFSLTSRHFIAPCCFGGTVYIFIIHTADSNSFTNETYLSFDSFGQIFSRSAQYNLLSNDGNFLYNFREYLNALNGFIYSLYPLYYFNIKGQNWLFFLQIQIKSLSRVKRFKWRIV